MTNHNYNTPEQGTEDWHEPLNENFERLDEDVEIRDTTDSLSEYEPKKNTKFLATDTGVVYIGVETENSAGETVVEWRRQGLLAQGDSLANEVVSEFAIVLGGLDNRASGPRAVVLGGKGNLASGRSAIAAGKRARAVHDGAVVIGDHTSTKISSRSNRELRSQMPVYAPSFNTTSARAEKTEIGSADPEIALAGVEALEISTWRFADPDTGRHMGPMADEFHEQFALGGDTDSIATVDADGVALAAIQGLSARLDDTRAELDARDDRLDEQRERIADLTAANERLRERNATLEERLVAVEAELGLDRDLEQ